MSQKSNLITVRNSYKNFNFLTQNNQNLAFVFLFKKLINRLFSLKGVANLDGDTVLEFVFGDDSNFASKVNYQISTPIDNKFANMDIQFSANNLKEVLNANKDSDATKFSLHYGDFASMIKIEFNTEEIISIYKMSQKENNQF